jgi:uncharacterized protein YjbI with pentapeptide repeats
MADREEQTGALLKDVRETASDVRNLTLTFILALLYVDIIIVSTTHEQLLRVSNVSLPLLSVELPIVGFYLFTPWLLFLLHLNLLIQHYLLSQQVFAFKRQLERVKSPARREQLVRNLGHLPFVHWLAGDHHGRGLRVLLAIVVQTSLVAWPLLTLLALQIAFVPYHKEVQVWVQRGALLLDAAATLWLWPKILHPSDSAIAWWKSAFPEWLRRTVRGGSESAAGRGVALISGTPLFFGAFIGAVVVWALLFSTVPSSQYEETLLRALPAWLQTDCKGRTMLILTCAVHESDSARLNRNLVVQEKVLAANKLDPDVENAIAAGSIPDASILGKVLGIDLSNRDLKYADFSRSSFPRADFRNSELTGVKFSEAKLISVKFSDPLVSIGLACQRGAQKFAEMARTDFSGAKLIDAMLDAARLHGAVLKEASMHGVTMRASELYGANLRNAWLDGADLRCAQLQGADLSGVSVVGANLQEAELIGVMIEEPINIEGARFLYATVHVGRIAFANSAAADFRQARLAGLEFAELKKQFEAVWARLGSGAGVAPQPADPDGSPGEDVSELGPGCSTEVGRREFRRIRSHPVARAIFLNMCRTVGAQISLFGVRPRDPCIRDFLSDLPKECDPDPFPAIRHLVEQLACRDRWLARSVLLRAVDPSPRSGPISLTEGDSPYPGLGEMIRERLEQLEKLQNSKGPCLVLKEELGRHLRRLQGL